MQDPSREDERTATDLGQLLVRLDTDHAAAWQKYQSLRLRLFKFFEWNQCAAPEELADEVLDRVARKPPDEQIRDVSEFIIGIARYVRLEAFKKSRRESHIDEWGEGQEIAAPSASSEDELIEGLDQERRLGCLRTCLASLKPPERALAIDYYSADEEKQKVHRRRLADTAGITLIALRVRANRLRANLEKCVTGCLQARHGSQVI